MKPKFFKNQLEFRQWLANNHHSEQELIVGFYKVSSGKLNMTWSQSVDEALVFGWIDGIRRSIDEISYSIRFTPRRASSNWSNINIKKIEILLKQGLMQEAGLDVFKKRKVEKSKNSGYENGPQKLTPHYETRFRANQQAWSFFTSQAPSYQKMVSLWILSAKQEKTQISRLEKAINTSEQQKRLI